MHSRKIGPWTLYAGTFVGHEEACNEDGPYTRRVHYVAVEALHDKGTLYASPREFRTEAEAEAAAYVDALPDTFDAGMHDDFNFVRNIYGSEAYAANWHEEEWDRMDEAERARR